jgi:IPT/TIG domain
LGSLNRRDVELTAATASTAGGIHAWAADLASGKPIELEIVNSSNARITAKLDYRFPAGIGGLFAAPTTKDNIAAIYRSWAARNPGLSADVVETSLIPENIVGWLDRARTYFSYAGVCSIDDLGAFRLAPNQALHPGAYVAPNKKSVSHSAVVALSHYAFTKIINNSIIHYRPNDTLHDTAIVLAGAWDIRGQTIVVGSDVRELVVIAKSIMYDAGSRITWDAPALPGPRTYFPANAANGANGSVPGERGHDGEAGDPDPHPARNGGTNAEVAAPIVTMYILDATSNLPPIDLRGQDGGGGGFGQIAGNGGDGAQGEHADSHFFSGCCRAVGWGGDGGNGGFGGRGGQGGRGGPGGRATLLTSDASIAVLAGSPPDVNVNPGGGGPGGPGGGGGAPGRGGPAGSADCELWCPSHPERHGSDGAGGGFGGVSGRSGDPGPNALSDALQVYPITPEQWNTVFNQPHILQVSPIDAEPDEIVTLSGQNFQLGTDKVFFDGVLQPDVSASVSSSTNAFVTVPHTAEGGTHPVVIRPAGASSRRSNRVMVRVIPKPDDIPVGTRWLEGQSQSLTGLAFAPGCQVSAEDWSVAGHPGISVPVISNTRTNIDLHIPNPPLGGLRGMRRVRVRNPDGGTNRAEIIVRLGDTILIRVAAFRVLGTTPGIGTARSVTDIASLFTEGDPHSIGVPWAQARISFQLAQPVGTITVADNIANIWPQQVLATDKNALNLGPGVAGAINIFFVRDVQTLTAYSWFGGGPIFCGDNAGDLSVEHLQAIAAHECGHALCLRHVCDGSGSEPPGTFFNRNCQSGDNTFLMFPHWNTQSGLTIPAGQVDAARIGATHFEEGKTNPLRPAAMLQNGLPPTIPLCQAVDDE